MSHNSAPIDRETLKALFHRSASEIVGQSLIHESATKHVTGAAQYIDDKADQAGTLHLAPRLSEHARAKILSIDTTPCYQVAGVVRVITYQDVPGINDVGPLEAGDPLLAEDDVFYVGQVLLVVAAENREAAFEAAALAKIEYQPLDAILDVREALKQQFYVQEPHRHQRGDADSALQRAAHRLQGEFHIGGQEHFYLETQTALVIPGEDASVTVYSSTQNPTEVQKLVASVLAVPMSQVNIDMRRMGGGFGGKETQAAGVACLCAVIARLTGRPAKMRLARSDDMQITGKRHPFLVRYQVGIDQHGRLQGVIIDLAADCGYSLDLSGSIVDRAMFHADNAYYLGDARITGYRCRTHTASNTAYRGFGGPQGMMAIEQIMGHIASFLGRDPLEIRQLNYYGGEGRNMTHYYQPVNDDRMPEITAQLIESAEYYARREAIHQFNASHSTLKRGLALTPVKFGISFTSGFLNQAGALLLIYTDGTVQLNHGGTEMGQGLNTKVIQVVAQVLGIDPQQIRVMATDTGKVPNTSPTAASSGADLNGKAAQIAAHTLRERLTTMLADKQQCAPEEIDFRHGVVRVGETYYSFAEVASMAWFSQVQLSATGYYKVPGLHYDRDAGRGEPFYYFAYGAACSEVIIDTLTGEYRLLRTDILHDVGRSLNPALDIGQIEGGFVQGQGWLTCEELYRNDKGSLMTRGPDSYKIPAVSDMPADFRVSLLENRSNAQPTVYHSKAVGEPPFMLAISVFSALQDAIAATSTQGRYPLTNSPVTPERVLQGIQRLRETVDA